LDWKSRSLEEQKVTESITAADNHHQHAINRIVVLIEELGFKEEIVAVGHRIVHGGEKFTSTVKVDQQVLEQIENMSDLAPLHNPAGAKGIEASMLALPTFRNLLFLILHFMKRCQRKHIPVAWRSRFTQNLVSVVMVSIAQAITM
jgi:acetate kinase